jgi:hypothetical protein
MIDQIVETYAFEPSALRFMPRALRRSAGLRIGESVPLIAVRWTGLRFQPGLLRAFNESAGRRADADVSVLLPQVIGFRLQMALLTHPAYPLPIWSALQVRNRLVRHERIDPTESLDLQTHVSGQRVVEEGIEVDLMSRLMRGTSCCWEGRTTFFYRGRFGDAEVADALATAPDLSGSSEIDRFRMPRGGGIAFGKLTGDYNGIHNWNWYARRLGFPQAFAHPQRVAAMCQSRLPAVRTDAQTLDLWINGPVFYRAQVRLNARDDAEGVTFGAALEGDPRYALAGRWRAGAQPLGA